MGAAAPNPLERLDFWLAVGLLFVVVLAGAVILYATDLWRKQEAKRPPTDALLSLNEYRELYEAGELTEAEYTKVRDRLAGLPKAPQPLPGPTHPPDPPPGTVEKPADPL